MIDDEENCHCGPCTAMNEPLTLEGDVRYLKAHIETKDRQLAEKDNALYDAEFRIRIYRDTVIDVENDNIRLREENERLTLYRTMIDDLSAQNRVLREEKDKLYNINCKSNNHVAELEQQVISLMGHKARYQQEILDLERHNEELFAALNSVRNTLMRAGDDIESLIRVD